MNCPNCGFANQEGASVCASCGTSLSAAPPPAPAPSAAPPSTAAVPTVGGFDLGASFSHAWQVFAANALALIVGLIVAGIVSILIITAPPMYAGIALMFLKAHRGEKVEIGDVFKGFEFFGQSWLYAIVPGIIFMVGYLICFALFFIIIGIPLLILWAFCFQVVFVLGFLYLVDQRLGFWDAFMHGLSHFRKNLGAAILVFLVYGVVFALGSWTIIGPFILGPMMGVAFAQFYDQSK